MFVNQFVTGCILEYFLVIYCKWNYGKRAESLTGTGDVGMRYPIISVERTGQKIKEACEEAGISAKDVQRFMNFSSTQSVYDWFRGKNLPSLDNFYALARLLDTPMESLIVDANSPQDGTRKRASLSICEITKRECRDRILFFYKDALAGIA